MSEPQTETKLRPPGGNIPLRDPYFRNLLIFLLVLTGIRILINALGLINLSGDEAQYWDWSRRLDWSYYSKPPGVAVFIWIGTHLFGNTELGVRFMAALFSLGAGLVMYGLGKRLIDAKTGAFAAMLLQIVPVTSLYGIGMTPDTPLLFFWVLSLYFVHRAWTDGKPAHWLGLMCSLGLCMLCKYAILFFYPCAILFLLFTQQGRRRLRTIWPYIAFLGSFLFFAPVIYWNSRHNWVMFRHDLGHTHAKDGFVFSPEDFFGFLGGQLGVVTPILCILILILVIRQRKANPLGFWFTIPVLIGFLLKSMQGKIQPNWVMTAWLAGLIPAAQFYARSFNKQKAWFRSILTAGWMIPAVIVLCIHILPFAIAKIPWPKGYSPVSKIVGFQQVAEEVTQLGETMDRPHFVFSDYYMITAEMAFYVDGQPETYCINLGSRMNQYDLWPGPDQYMGKDAIYITKNQPPPVLIEHFDEIILYTTVLDKYRIYQCKGMKSWPTSKAKTY